MFQQATLPLLFVLSPALQPDPGAAFERRLRKAALSHGPVILGTATAPYEPMGRPEENPLRRVLLREEGLEIAITTGNPRILRELDLLVELDRRHSVAVRMVISASAAEDPEPWMLAVRTLAVEGIATSVLLSAPAPVGEETLRFLLEEALAAGAFDVEIDAHSLHRRERDRLLETFGRLRLEYGFPRGGSGRG